MSSIVEAAAAFVAALAAAGLAATNARRRDFPHVARVFLTARDQHVRKVYPFVRAA